MGGRVEGVGWREGGGVGWGGGKTADKYAARGEERLIDIGLDEGWVEAQGGEGTVFVTLYNVR